MSRFTALILIIFSTMLICTVIAAPHTTEVEYHDESTDGYIRQSHEVVIDGVQMERRNLLAKIVEHKIKKAFKKGFKAPKKLMRANKHGLKKLNHIVG